MLALLCPCCEREKKQTNTDYLREKQRDEWARDPLAAFIQRLRDLCPDNGQSIGQTRSDRFCAEAQQTVLIAREFGILKNPDFSLGHFNSTWSGTEHLVDLDEHRQLVAKTTKPPGFGLIPALLRLPLAVRPGDPPAFRCAIEFIPATPLEYLLRWQMNNEVFGDNVRLESVIQWQDGRVSFGISQPQYQGEPADPRDIEEYFTNNGWESLSDPSGHRVFYHYGFHVMAIDAESRNCYLTAGGLQPFDVILFKPEIRSWIIFG